MNISELLLVQLKGLRDEIDRTLKDLGDEQINWQPNPKANSIGFVVWHALRVWDWDYYRMGGEELYEKDGWSERFGFETKGKGLWGAGFGTNFTMEDIAGMPMRSAVLRDYLEALWARTEQYLSRVTEAELLREFPNPRRPEVMLSAARLLTHTLTHSYIHTGEAQYIRGLMTT